MHFTPDCRNVGGRSMIVSQLWGHRLCLKSIKERQIDIKIKSPVVKKPEHPSTLKLIH